MKVYKIPGEYLGENTYFAVIGKDCLIIDPGADSARIFDFCKRRGLTIRALLLTHAHIDHMYGLPAFEKAGYPIYLHAEDERIINSRANLALAFGLSFERIDRYQTFDGEECELSLAPFRLQAIHTPGHTAGSVCYYSDGVLFSGDTLFAGSYGRTDLPTGDEQDLLCSIANELFELPSETLVYAGHSDGISESEECAPDTTIGVERETNPIFDLL